MPVHALLVGVVHRDGVIAGVLDFLAAIQEFGPGGGHGVDAGFLEDGFVVEEGAHEGACGNVIPGFAVRGKILGKSGHTAGDGGFQAAARHIGGQILQVLGAQSGDVAKTALHNVDLYAGVKAGF